MHLVNPSENSPASRLFLRSGRGTGLAALALALGVLPAQAATSVWVPTGGTQSWFTPANWSPTSPTAADNAVFSTNGIALVEGGGVATASNIALGSGGITIGDFTAGTLTVGGQVALLGGRLTLNLGTLSLNNLTIGSSAGYSDTRFGTLRLTGAGAGIQLASINVLVNSTIAGTDGLALTGAGTLALAGDNTYSGGTTINATSTLLVGNNGATGTLGAGAVANAGSLIFGRTDTMTVGNLITGTGSVRQGGNGTTILTADNTYTGGTSVTAGTLQVGDGGTTGSLGTGAVVNNANLVFNRSDEIVLANVVSGNGSLTQAGAGRLTLTGANTYAGATLVTAGVLQVGAGGTTGSLGTGNVNLGTGATLVFNRSDAVTVGGQIAGAGNLIQTGGGTLTLTGNNVYGGSTAIFSGTIQVGNGGNTGLLGTGAVANNGTLIFNRSDNVVVANAIGGTGSVVQAGAGTVALTGDNTYAGVTNIFSGTLQVGNAGNTGSLGGGAVNNNGTLAFARSDSLTVANLISGAGGVRQGGNGTVTLLADNTYAGGTVINGGTLQVGNGGATGSLGSGDVTDNGTLVFNRSGDLTITNVITGAGNLSHVGGGKLTLTGNNALGGAITISGGTLQVGTGGTTGSLGTGGINNNGALIFNRSDSLLVTGQIVGTGSLTHAGTGTLILAGNTGYAGGTTIDSGTLQVGNGGASGSLGTGAVVNNGALVFNRSDNVQMPNAISGTGTLTQAGTGTIALTANNTNSGNTLITSGTLQVGNGGGTGSLGNGDVVVSGAGTLAFARGDAVVFANTIRGTGRLQLLGGSLTLTGANVYTGGTTVTSGTLQVGNGGTLGSIGIGDIANESRIVFNRSDGYLVPGAISGAGSVFQSGTGTLVLTGNNTYAGGTQVDSGTLQVGNGGTSGSLGTGVVINLGTIVVNRSDTVVVPGAISGTGVLRQAGTGRLTLTGANDYTGGTVIAAGTLQVGDGGTGGSLGTGAVTNNGALVFNRRDEVAVGGVIDGSGSVRHSGGGAVTLSGLNTYAGGTVVDGGGTLRLLSATADGRGDLTVSNGVLRVDSASATARTRLAVGGTYTQAAGTALELGVAGGGATQFDSVSVTGRATVNGALRLSAVGGYRPVHNTRLALLTAGGGVTGRFTSFTHDFTYSPLLTPLLGYGANEVSLTWEHASFQGFAGTRNQAAVAAYLDSILPSTEAADVALVDHLDYDYPNLRSGLPAAFERISPEALAAIFTTSFSVMDGQATSLRQRADELRADYPAIYRAALRDLAASPEAFDAYLDNPWSVHLEFPMNDTEVKDDVRGRGYTVKTRGLTLGLDRQYRENFFFGFSGLYANSEARLKEGGEVDTRSFGLDVYGLWSKRGLHLLGMLGVVSGTYDTARQSLGGTAIGSANGVSWTALGGGGYDYQKGGLKVGVDATFQYMSAGVDRLTEGGSVAPLRLLSQSSESAYGQAGFNLRYRARVLPWTIVTPQAYVGFRHELMGDHLTVEARSATGAGNTFTVIGPKLGTDSVVGSLGLSVQWRPAVNTSVHYTRHIGRSGFESENLQFGTRLSF